MQGAVALRFLGGVENLGVDLGLHLTVALLAPCADADEVDFEPLDRIAQRPGGPLVLGAIFRRIVRGRVGAGAVGDPFDQRRAEIGAGPLDRPERGRVDRKIVVAVDAQRGNAEAVRARRESRALAPRYALIGGDRPLVVDDIENDRWAVDGGEHERRVEIALRRRAFADPARGDVRIAGNRRGHRPADCVGILRAEIARDGEETGFFERIEPGKLAAIQMILLVGEDLAHHVDDRPAERDQEALLAVGWKAHVALGKRLAMGGRDRLLAEAGDVERRLALALGEQHARVEGAGQHHMAQTLALFFGVERPRPLAGRFAVVVERADHRIGEIADVGRADVDRRTGNLARLGDADMAEIGPSARAHGRLRHVQRKTGGAGHHGSPAARFGGASR